ncbi:hypothetical protein CCR75_002043 [Bremia lactucae]|uniref:CAX-interacting protein 4 n=1 Tax=Bremia lactucae TaxID=4779 RepID=A0A976IBF9_BRELC|nr:hypothetical protein CCR75_002043 [Bremia lactucae]
MPATAGRVRMPHNNRMHSSAALKMTGMWKNTIGYDPYAAENEKQEKTVDTSFEQAKGLMALAKLSNKSNDVRGACKKCKMVGHLTFQCRNYLGEEDKQKLSDSDSSSLSDSSDGNSETEAKRLSSQHFSTINARRKDRSKRRSRSRSIDKLLLNKVPSRSRGSCRESSRDRFMWDDREAMNKRRKSRSLSVVSYRMSANRRRRLVSKERLRLRDKERKHSSKKRYRGNESGRKFSHKRHHHEHDSSKSICVKKRRH